MNQAASITAAAEPSISDLVFGIADGFARLATMPKVYPAYIGFQIKAALKALAENGDPTLDGPIVTEVGGMETIGDCRYAIPVTDHNGTIYRITVEVLPAAKKVVA